MRPGLPAQSRAERAEHARAGARRAHQAAGARRRARARPRAPARQLRRTPCPSARRPRRPVPGRRLHPLALPHGGHARRRRAPGYFARSRGACSRATSSSSRPPTPWRCCRAGGPALGPGVTLDGAVGALSPRARRGAALLLLADGAGRGADSGAGSDAASMVAGSAFAVSAIVPARSASGVHRPRRLGRGPAAPPSRQRHRTAAPHQLPGAAHRHRLPRPRGGVQDPSSRRVPAPSASAPTSSCCCSRTTRRC
jgi:hypothetical protein